MIIESKENKKVKYINKLRNVKYMNEEKKFIIEGKHLVDEAYKNNLLLETISIEDTNYNVPNTIVNDKIMKYLSNLSSKTDIIGICKYNNDKKLGNKIIILDNVQDPGNIGTIIRSANAFNFDTVVLSLDSVNKYNDKLIRASQGMIFSMNVITRDIKKFILELKKEKYLICGTDVVDGIKVNSIKNNDKIAIIMGNEGSGVSDEIKSLSDKNIYIPTSNTCESLNVAVASSIIMYEITKED